MQNRNIGLLKSTMILSIGQIIPKFLAFIILPILTAYLSQKDYGLYELTLSVASFCVPMLSLQIQQGVFRFLIENRISKKSIITDSFLFVISIFSLSAVPIIFFWYLYTNDLIISILFFLAYFSEMILTWEGQTVRGLGDNISYSVAYVIYSIIFLTSVIVVLKLSGILLIRDIAVSMIIAYCTAALYLFFKVKLYTYIVFISFNKEILLILLSYSWPMVISSVALWIVNLSDRFFVSALLGIEVTAVYGVANKIPNLFNSFYGVFNLAWTENTSKLTRSEKNSDYYSVFFRSFYNVMVGMMLFLICSSPVLFKVLIDEKYNSAYSLMPWLFIGVFFNSLASFFGSIYVGEKRTKDVGVSSAIGAVINIAINFLLMRRFGVIVAAISTIVSYAIICTYRAYDIKKYVHIEYNYQNIAFGLIIIILVSLANSQYDPVRWLFSIAVMMIFNFISNRKFAKLIISKGFQIVRKR